MTTQTITVHIDPVLNPLSDGGQSMVGHMWFALTNELGNQFSYGFALKTEGCGWGEGRVYTTDDAHYVDSRYNYTQKITDEQCIAVESFAERAAQNAENYAGRWEEYSGVCNSSVDFTWPALNQGGLTDTPEDGWQENLLSWFNRWNVEQQFMNQNPFEKWWDKTKDTVSDGFVSLQRFVHKERPTYILNLNGIEIVSPNLVNPILFDHGGSGFKTCTDWIVASNGSLVLDRNCNGTIDDDITSMNNVGTNAVGYSVISINMNGSQLALLDQAYSAFKESVYDALLQQTRLKPYLDDIGLSLTSTGTGIAFDLHHLMGGILEAANWDGLVLFADWVATDAVISTLRAFGLQAANDVVFVIRRAG